MNRKPTREELQNCIGGLLGALDELLEKSSIGSMHTYGQTPDWFVEAASHACGLTVPEDYKSRFSSDGKVEGLNTDDVKMPEPQDKLVVEYPDKDGPWHLWNAGKDYKNPVSDDALVEVLYRSDDLHELVFETDMFYAFTWGYDGINDIIAYRVLRGPKAMWYNRNSDEVTFNPDTAKGTGWVKYVEDTTDEI